MLLGKLRVATRSRVAAGGREQEGGNILPEDPVKFPETWAGERHSHTGWWRMSGPSSVQASPLSVFARIASTGCDVSGEGS